MSDISCQMGEKVKKLIEKLVLEVHIKSQWLSARACWGVDDRQATLLKKISKAAHTSGTGAMCYYSSRAYSKIARSIKPQAPRRGRIEEVKKRTSTTY